jgi:hypothetical protein
LSQAVQEQEVHTLMPTYLVQVEAVQAEYDAQLEPQVAEVHLNLL